MAQGVTLDELTCSQEEAVTAASAEASTRGTPLASLTQCILVRRMDAVVLPTPLVIVSVVVHKYDVLVGSGNAVYRCAPPTGDALCARRQHLCL